MADLVLSTRGTGSHFLGYIKQRIERNKNFLCAVCGPTGSGKSYSAMRIAEILDPSFSVDRVVFTPAEFMRLINDGTLGVGSVIVFDEAGVGMSSKQWQSLQNKLLNFLLQTFRHRNYIVIFTSPHLGFMDASSRKLLHAYLETVSINPKKKTCTLKPLLLQLNQRSGEAYYKYLRVITPGKGVSPLSRLNVGLPTSDLVREYEMKKTEFTTSLNQNIQEEIEESDAFQGPTLTIKQENVLALLKEKKNAEQIAETLGVSELAIMGTIAKLKKKKYIIRNVKAGLTLGRDKQNKTLYFEVEEPKNRGAPGPSHIDLISRGQPPQVAFEPKVRPYTAPRTLPVVVGGKE